MKKYLFIFSVLATTVFSKTQAQASDPFLGQIAFVAFNFAPRGWAECKGQLLPINQNQALFSLLGTTYGGNGTTNFALPNMQGRVPVGDGQGSGLSLKILGQQGGAESVRLTQNEMPIHTHLITGTTEEGNTNLPTNAMPANTKALDKEYYDNTKAVNGSSPAVIVPMNPTMVSATGGNQAHENMQPYLTLKCIIATEGIYPSRP